MNKKIEKREEEMLWYLVQQKPDVKLPLDEKKLEDKKNIEYMLISLNLNAKPQFVKWFKSKKVKAYPILVGFEDGQRNRVLFAAKKLKNIEKIKNIYLGHVLT